MGFITARLIPRNVRRAAQPIRTGKNALTPRAVKQVRGGISKVTNPIDTLGYAVTAPRKRKGKRRPSKSAFMQPSLPRTTPIDPDWKFPVLPFLVFTFVGFTLTTATWLLTIIF